MQYILSIDQGTTGTRSMIFDKNGAEVSKDYIEHRQFYPKTGWVEHDPVEIWEKTLTTFNNSITNAKLNPTDICAIGVTNQRETIVAWNKSTGKPLYNAIVWQCRRTADICDDLKKSGYSDLFKKKTGLVLDPYFSGTKIKWLLENSTKVQDALKTNNLLVGTIDSWIIWNLTGNHITDCSNASRTLLFNIHKGEWDQELLDLLNIPYDILPEVRASSDKETYGLTKNDLFSSQLPIAGDAGDQQAALFGQTCFEEGYVKNTYGTGNFMLLNTGERAIESKKGLLTTIAWKVENSIKYALEGSIFITGAAIQWLEEGLKILNDKNELITIMNNIETTDDVFFVPAFVGLGAPFWDSHARGAILGLTRGTTREHVIRATLESICYQSEAVFEIMREESGIDINMLRVDGGVTKCSPLLQFQADISNVVVQKPSISETTALGAAYLAGLAVNYWDTLDDIRENFLVEEVYTPQMSYEKRNSLITRWKKAAERSKNWS